MQGQRIMSNEETDERASNQVGKTRRRFKVTVVCVGLIAAAVAYAIGLHSGDSYLAAVPAALLTYLAILISGVLLDLINFRSK
jgi:hypothetical protein